MTANRTSPSGLSRGFAAKEEWQEVQEMQELVSLWDGEIFDPLFQGDITFAGTTAFGDSFSSEYNAPESVTSDQPYIPSAPTSVVDGPSSFDYTLSGPPSIVDGPSSVGQTYSWLSTSPSYSTTATSPIAARNNKLHHGSFKTSDHVPSPVLGPTTDSPLQDTRGQSFTGSFNSANSFSTASPYLFNPFIAGSPHSFNSLDVNASHAFTSVGGWTEQPQVIESIPELEHSGAIPIPQPSTSFNDNLPPLSDFREVAQAHSPPRAITIPQPNCRPASFNHSAIRSQWALSASPDAQRRHRSNTLSRSNSRNEQRRARNSLTTPSPTSNTFGWVSYQPNPQNNGRLVPSGTDGNKGRRQRGRTRGLSAEQRRDAAIMRVIGACSNCKRRKEKCDPGTPCKSCLDHYKGSLIHNPCRDRLLADLAKAFISDRLGWHPTARPLESFIAPGSFDVMQGISYTIPMNLGFGPMLHLPVHALNVEDSNALFHEHVVYSWPPTNSKDDIHTHAVLPAVLTPEALSNLPQTLDSHLSLLVTHHFRSFPLYCSPLRILREVYIYYRTLLANSAYARLLLQALKLLVLVHIGGDLTLPATSEDPVLAQLVRTTIGNMDSDDITPTPCFIRSQLGSVMPTLALSLMRDVLSSLEQLLLNRECHEWPITLAVLIVVLMVIESIHYHAAKLPYHHAYGAAPNATSIAQDRKVDEQGVESLFKFYTACFSGCHSRLRPGWEGENTSQGVDADDKFIESVREAIKNASPGSYLQKRATDEREADDMGFFFDRLVSRLLVLKA